MTRMLTVYPARQIHTMNPSLPNATAAVVSHSARSPEQDDLSGHPFGSGEIVEVGTMDSVQPWLDAYPHQIDTTFADKVLFPGFIDPHLHPSLAATLLPMNFITAMEWVLPDRTAPATTSHEAFLDELRRLDRETPAGEPVFTWGYHELWHGSMSRQLLDSITTDRPVIVWQRSFHEIFVNSATFTYFEIDEQRMDKHPQVDVAAGRFFESGMGVGAAAMSSYIMDPNRFRHGLELAKAAVHQGGHTTIGDLTGSQFDSDTEWASLHEVIGTDTTPFRVQMIPVGARSLKDDLGREDPGAWLQQVADSRGSDRLYYRNNVKLFTDGGFYAQLMRLKSPGFIDGHQGEWMIAPEQFESLARGFWNAGCQIHVHCTGDMGFELALDVLGKLQWERPRFDHRFTIEHMGISSPEQVRRLAKLGGLVSANVYYLHELGDAYWKHSIGHERASQMSRIGTSVREGIPTALHSDFTMAPAKPLTSAWVAVNRLSESGEVLAPDERISVHQAMKAITCDAAYVLGMEHRIGTIRAGKSADFTVLEADPYLEPPEALKDIPIWGTVFEGTPHQIAHRHQ